MKSAIRRHHYYRLQKKRRWYWGGPGEFRPQPNRIIFELSEEERLGRLANTPHPCSRFCCANRRRFEGPSISEIRRAPRIEDW